MRTQTILAAMALSSSAVAAQNFTIDWYTIDGGGGTSAGGNFSLSGTIGQPDAGETMTGAGFALCGGLWSLFAAQTANPPSLTIVRTAANDARLSWPSSATGFVLQQSSDLNSTDWVNVPQAVNDNGTAAFITVNLTGDLRYYRLFKP